MVTEAMHMAEVSWDFLEDIYDFRLSEGEDSGIGEGRKPGDDVMEQKGEKYQNRDGQWCHITLRGQEYVRNKNFTMDDQIF